MCQRKYPLAHPIGEKIVWTREWGLLYCMEPFKTARKFDFFETGDWKLNFQSIGTIEICVSESSKIARENHFVDH